MSSGQRVLRKVRWRQPPTHSERVESFSMTISSVLRRSTTSVEVTAFPAPLRVAVQVQSVPPLVVGPRIGSPAGVVAVAHAGSEAVSVQVGVRIYDAAAVVVHAVLAQLREARGPEGVRVIAVRADQHAIPVAVGGRDDGRVSVIAVRAPAAEPGEAIPVYVDPVRSVAVGVDAIAVLVGSEGIGRGGLVVTVPRAGGGAIGVEVQTLDRVVRVIAVIAGEGPVAVPVDLVGRGLPVAVRVLAIACFGVLGTDVGVQIVTVSVAVGDAVLVVVRRLGQRRVGVVAVRPARRFARPAVPVVVHPVDTVAVGVGAGAVDRIWAPGNQVGAASLQSRCPSSPFAGQPSPSASTPSRPSQFWSMSSPKGSGSDGARSGSAGAQSSVSRLPSPS